MTVDTRASEQATPSLSGRMADAARQAAHLSHEAQMVKSLAEDAIEEGAYKARRAVKSVRRGLERLEDLRDDGLRYAKRQPAKTMALTAGVGLVVGLAVGWIAGRGRGKRDDAELS